MEFEEGGAAPGEGDPEDILGNIGWWWTQAWPLFLGGFAGYIYSYLSSYYSKIADHRDLGMGNARSAAASAGTFVTNQFSTNNKMALVVRTDLGMGKGKVAAQCAHAAVACYRRAVRLTPSLVKQWEVFGEAKVTLKADSADELDLLRQQAETEGLATCIVRDAGRTQVEAGTSTVLGVGPGPAKAIDRVTGHLKLY